MNFYVSISQLLQATESLEKNLNHLAERAFRVIPRDSRANREILEEAAAKMKEAKELLEENPHLSKISLRHASLLLQIFRLSFFRMTHLAFAKLNLKEEEKEALETVDFLFLVACRHFAVLKRLLSDLAGVPLTLELEGPDEKEVEGVSVFRREESYHRTSINLLEKAIELFDDEPALLDSLVRIRQELLDSRKKMRHFMAIQPVQKAAVLVPAFPQK